VLENQSLSPKAVPVHKGAPARQQETGTQLRIERQYENAEKKSLGKNKNGHAGQTKGHPKVAEEMIETTGKLGNILRKGDAETPNVQIFAPPEAKGRVRTETGALPTVLLSQDCEGRT